MLFLNTLRRTSVLSPFDHVSRPSEPDIHITGNTAWISYVNKGSITDAYGTVKQNWLESAFLEKQAGTWKILFMHSTRVPVATQVGY